MLCNIGYMTKDDKGGLRMSRGLSGRLVVEMDPQLKRELYSALASDGLTFKNWLVERVERYIIERRQPDLLAAEPRAMYRAQSDR